MMIAFSDLENKYDGDKLLYMSCLAIISY